MPRLYADLCVRPPFGSPDFVREAVGILRELRALGTSRVALDFVYDLSDESQVAPAASSGSASGQRKGRGRAPSVSDAIQRFPVEFSPQTLQEIRDGVGPDIAVYTRATIVLPRDEDQPGGAKSRGKSAVPLGNGSVMQALHNSGTHATLGQFDIVAVQVRFLWGRNHSCAFPVC
jgi:hypothetical protein